MADTIRVGSTTGLVIHPAWSLRWQPSTQMALGVIICLVPPSLLNLCVQIALPLVGGSALGIYAALNIHTTLQYIGVLGVILTVVNKALSYDSPAAAFEDAKGAVGGAQKALSKLGSIKAPSLPNLPKPSVPKMPQAAVQPAAAMSGSSGSSAAAGAVMSAAAVGGGAGGRGEDAGEETEAELVD